MSGGTHPGPGIQNYGTPWYIVRALEAERRRRYARDVCAEAWSAKADDYIALPRDGLVEDWAELNWCNPEYRDQASWMRRASWWSTHHGLTTDCLVRVSTDSRYWIRLVALRARCDFYIGRIPFIAPPGGLWLKAKDGGARPGHLGTWRFVKGGDPIPGTSFASAIVSYGPDCEPGAVRWRDASDGRLINIHRARELRAAEASAC